MQFDFEKAVFVRREAVESMLGCCRDRFTRRRKPRCRLLDTVARRAPWCIEQPRYEEFRDRA